jgi:hypothetical protein
VSFSSSPAKAGDRVFIKFDGHLPALAILDAPAATNMTRSASSGNAQSHYGARHRDRERDVVNRKWRDRPYMPFHGSGPTVRCEHDRRTT